MKYIEIETGERLEATDNLVITRSTFYDSISENLPEVAIFISAYNNLAKTKNCIESIFKYCSDIDYELFLVDNGSEDGMLEYFQGLEYSKKTVVRITNNIGLSFAVKKAFSMCENRYIFMIGNDIIVTKNAMQNLLTCIKSDRKIGIVASMSSNCSNAQDPKLVFSSMEEMQQKAEQFNQSNPMKWQERMRVLPSFACFRKELIDLVGVWDSGFYHDFLEDDFTTRVRHAGFKMILCGDAFVHHDHIYSNFTSEEQGKSTKSLESGRKNYKQKYNGLDAWDDINNYEFDLTANITTPINPNPTVLGVDVRCGTPILEIRNRLRNHGVFRADSYAFTTQAKYYADLQLICNDVKCDRMDFIADYYTAELFDYIILGEPVNTYNKPLTIIQKLYEFLKKDGTLLFKLRNTADIRNLLYTMGNLNSLRDEDMPSCINVDDMDNFLVAIGAKNINVITQSHSISQTSSDKVKHIITSALQTKNVDDALMRAVTADYLFCVKK